MNASDAESNVHKQAVMRCTTTQLKSLALTDAWSIVDTPSVVRDAVRSWPTRLANHAMNFELAIVIYGVRDRLRFVVGEDTRLLVSGDDEAAADVVDVWVWLGSLQRANQSLVARKYDFHHTWPSVCQCQRHSEARGERDRTSRGILVTLEAYTKLLRQSHLMC